MKATKLNIIIAHIFIWPMFSEARNVFVHHPVVFRFINVDIFFQFKKITACYENVYSTWAEVPNFARHISI